MSTASRFHWFSTLGNNLTLENVIMKVKVKLVCCNVNNWSLINLYIYKISSNKEAEN